MIRLVHLSLSLALSAASVSVASAAPANPAPASATDPAPVLQRTEALINAFKQVKRAPEGTPLTAAQRAENAKTFAVLDGLLASEVISSTPITPHQAAFKPEQLETFKTLFWQTLRLVAYPDSGQFFEDAKYTLAAPVQSGLRFDIKMHAELEEQDIETDVVFHWQAINGTLRVVDVSFDGASLMTDYTNQFGRIIKKKGAAGLMAILQKKHDQVQKALGH
jgi:ABC-type transporter MlaC component